MYIWLNDTSVIAFQRSLTIQSQLASAVRPLSIHACLLKQLVVATEDVLQLFAFVVLSILCNPYFYCDVVVMTKMNCTGQEWQR